jgi:hypothetical protein
MRSPSWPAGLHRRCDPRWSGKRSSDCPDLSEPDHRRDFDCLPVRCQTRITIALSGGAARNPRLRTFGPRTAQRVDEGRLAATCVVTRSGDSGHAPSAAGALASLRVVIPCAGGGREQVSQVAVPTSGAASRGTDQDPGLRASTNDSNTNRRARSTGSTSCRCDPENTSASPAAGRKRAGPYSGKRSSPPA